ncbi:MAG: molecular chaperone DnaJ [Sphingomonadaceae bacterium]|nr:molecular chaperone DnaJ [Sphingomonadaceae bacterium]
MILALIAVAALTWWLHRDGLLLPNLRRFGVAAGAALVAARLVTDGAPFAAAAVVAAGVWWWTASRPVAMSDVAAARALLGVDAAADAAAIRTAWRQAIADAHPDRGGSTDLAARLTAARDLLLRSTGR